MRKKTFKVLILDQKWKVSLVEAERFQAEHDNCAAITYTDKHEIVFHTEDLTFNTIVHEVMHAYYSMLDLESSQLRGWQIEEAICSLHARRWPSILSTACFIFAKLRANPSLERDLQKRVNDLRKVIEKMETQDDDQD